MALALAFMDQPNEDEAQGGEEQAGGGHGRGFRRFFLRHGAVVMPWRYWNDRS
jgi:hypothetical protein